MKQVSLLDRMGISLSGLCAIHCLFFPIAIAMLPLWPVAEAIHAWTHPILFVLIVPTVVFSVRKNKTDVWISILLYSGLTVIGLAWLLHDWIGSWGEALVTMAGSILLISGHWKNFKYHQILKQCQHETT